MMVASRLDTKGLHLYSDDTPKKRDNTKCHAILFHVVTQLFIFQSAFPLSVVKPKEKQLLQPQTDRDSAMSQPEFKAITCNGVKRGKMRACKWRLVLVFIG